MADSEVATAAAASTTDTAAVVKEDSSKQINGTEASAKEDSRLSNGEASSESSLVNGKNLSDAADSGKAENCSKVEANGKLDTAANGDKSASSLEKSDSSKESEKLEVTKKSESNSEKKEADNDDDEPMEVVNGSSDEKTVAKDDKNSEKCGGEEEEKEDKKDGEKDAVKEKDTAEKSIIEVKDDDDEGSDNKDAADKGSDNNKDGDKGGSDNNKDGDKGSDDKDTEKGSDDKEGSGSEESPSKKAEDSADGDTPSKKKKKKKLSLLEDDGTPKETRRSSRQRKPVSYIDDVKTAATAAAAATANNNNNSGSDIEMIDDGDPLSISDADKKGQKEKSGIIVIDTNTLLRNQGNLAAAVAQQTAAANNKSTTNSSTLQQLNQQIINHSITLTQHPPPSASQQSSNSHHHQQHHHHNTNSSSNSSSSPVVVAHHQHQQQQQQQQQQTPQQMLQTAVQNVSSVGGNLNIGGINLSAAAIANNPAALQNAIAAITGGSNAPAGLKNAYITAVQQVLVQQQAAANTTPAGQQYLANLQQYYNTLGALRDEAYVIEAPSFIVPYVMEGKPKEAIKEYLKKVNKEQEEFEKKEAAEKAKEEAKHKKETGDTEDNKEQKKDDDKEDADKKEKDIKEKDKKEKDTKEKDTKEKEKDKKVEDEKMETDEKDDAKTEKKTADKDDVKESEDKKDEDSASKEKDGEEKEKKKDDENKENKDENVADTEKLVKSEDFSHLGRWEGYYKSTLGSFMLELGLTQVQEFIQADLLKMQKRKLDKMKTAPSRQDIMGIKALDRQLSKSREKNAHLHLPTKLCKFCNYRTDCQLVMDRHLESPHMVNYTYKCNYCDFETRGPQVILFHMEAEHMVKGRLERAPAFFQCQLCPFEDNNKSKMTRHSFSCAKKFKPEKNCDLLDWEPPAKIPKQISRGRGGGLPMGTNIKNIGGNLYDSAGRSLLPKGLPAGLTMQQLQNAVAQGILPNNAAANNMSRGRGRPIGSYKSQQPGQGINRPMMPGSYNPRAGSPGNLSQSQQLALAGQLFQGIQSAKGGNGNVGGSLKGSQTPSISITALPRGTANSISSATASGVKTATGKDGKPSFVICEICDGYIKDLEQLRNHMNFIHKVKIHPKMIHNRPPLNCQKCQHRFFTDQGLERHLLGTHGLVTSSMQEAANKSKDAGRCPICGKVFQWKLLNHVGRDHKMTLKPAHLSYKCTVCTATFNMYRLFENHVYSAHSVANKQQQNKDGSSGSSKTTNGSSEAPLKINDEITIIPQPTGSKNTSNSSVTAHRIMNDAKKRLDATTANVSKEITITKVGTAPIANRGNSSGGNNRGASSGNTSGGGATIKPGSSVELISLDDSPAKKISGLTVTAAGGSKRPAMEAIAGPSKKAKTA